MDYVNIEIFLIDLGVCSKWYNQRMLDSKSKQILRYANLMMIVTIIIHDCDHVRQALCLNYQIGLNLWLVNISVYIPSLIALFLIFKNKKSASIATSANGLLVAAAFAEVHLWRPSLKVWGLWNKNFFLLGADAISWSILAITIFVGVGVAMAGTYVRGRTSLQNI